MLERKEAIMLTTKMHLIGRVQGVGCRFLTTQLAKKMQLTGTVRNLSNGNVEIILHACKADRTAFIKELSNLPGPLYIKEVRILNETNDASRSDFKPIY